MRSAQLYNGTYFKKFEPMNPPSFKTIRPMAEMPFIYGGCRFVCQVEHVLDDAFQPHVRYESGMPGVAATALQDDTQPYTTMAEASRHAQQQAIRWVHDHQGDGAGRF
jgi:hypothetical protein